MAEYIIQEETLNSLADAIRSKTGTTEVLSPAQMISAIDGIETGGGSTDGTGSTIETCTVTFTGVDISTSRVIYSKLIDGVITHVDSYDYESVHTDVVCGTLFCALDEGNDIVPTGVTGDATIAEYGHLSNLGAIIMVNGDCTIQLEYAEY